MDDFKNRLKIAHLRITPHRIQILQTLDSAGKPLSHTEIIQSIPEEKRIDRVTLYRILASLTEAALVHQVQGTDGIWRFCTHFAENDTCPGGHPHLLCEKCGSMICLKHIKLPHIDVPDDFEVHHKQMLIVGICSKCQIIP